MRSLIVEFRDVLTTTKGRIEMVRATTPIEFAAEEVETKTYGRCSEWVYRDARLNAGTDAGALPNQWRRAPHQPPSSTHGL